MQNSPLFSFVRSTALASFLNLETPTSKQSSGFHPLKILLNFPPETGHGFVTLPVLPWRYQLSTPLPSSPIQTVSSILFPNQARYSSITPSRTSTLSAPTSAFHLKHLTIKRAWTSFIAGLLPAGLKLLGPAIRNMFGYPHTANPMNASGA